MGFCCRHPGATLLDLYVVHPRAMGNLHGIVVVHDCPRPRDGKSLRKCVGVKTGPENGTRRSAVWSVNIFSNQANN